jgi:hypothetical protein
MFPAHVKAAHARLSFDEVEWMGTDGVNRREGHNLNTFAVLIVKRVRFARAERNSSLSAAFAAEFLLRNVHLKVA